MLITKNIKALNIKNNVSKKMAIHLSNDSAASG